MNTLKLMRQVRLKTFTRTITRAKGSRAFQYFSLALFGLMLSLFVFFASLSLFRSLSNLDNGSGIAALALSGVYTLAAFGLILTGLAGALYTMYLSDDLRVPLAMPLRERTVFAYKFWETFASNLPLFVVLGLPILLAYGVGTGASALFYPATVVVSALVIMIPTSLCVLLIMPLMRVIPPGRAKEIVAAAGALAGVIVWAAFYLSTSSTGADSNLSALQRLGEAPALHAPPGSWAADAVVSAAVLDLGQFLGGLLPLAGLSFGMYAVCLGLARWAYAAGWARATESGGQVRSSGRIEAAFGWLPQDLRAVVVKDLTSLPRDFRRLAGLAAPVAMGLVFALNIFQFSGHRAEPSLSPYLVAGGLAAFASSSTQAVGVEGRGYGFIAASPLSPGRFILGKIAGGAAVGAAVSVLGALALSLVPGFFYLPGLLMGSLGGPVAALVVAAYTVGVSAMFPRFDWENPNQATTTEGGLLLALCLFGLFALGGICFGIGSLLERFTPAWAAASIAALIWVAVAAIPAYAVASAGAANLKRMEWDL